MRAKSKAVQVDTKSEGCETKECLWDEIGFHRPLGGLLYNLTLIVLTILFGVVVNLYILPRWVYPFPETLGWQDMTNQIFYLTFVIADLGIGAALQRFIGEIAVKEPRKSLQYIRFFIWFQMFTGLMQITGIAAWVSSRRAFSCCVPHCPAQDRPVWLEDPHHFAPFRVQALSHLLRGDGVLWPLL